MSRKKSTATKRISVYIAPEQAKALKTLRENYGISTAGVVRMALALYMREFHEELVNRE